MHSRLFVTKCDQGIHPAGPPGGDPLEFTREQWQDAHRELMLGPMALIEAALPGMRERGFGRILNISSTAAGPSPREPHP